MNRYMATQEAIQPQGQDAIGQGAARGIDAARTSLSLTPNISRPSAMARAIGGGAAAFKAPQPGTGQAGMLNSIAQAMGPAMQEYYKEIDTRNALQMQMAEAEQEQQNKMMDREYRQQVLGETSRHHRAIEAEHAARMQASRPQFTRDGIDISNHAPVPKGAMASLNKQKFAFGRFSKEIEDLEKDFKAFDELTKNNMIEPGNPYVGGAVNAAKKAYGYMASGKTAQEVRKETLLRDRIQQKSDKLRVTAESALKGGGALAQGMYDRLTSLNLYPTTNEPADERNQKISAIKKEALSNYGALKDSVQYGVFIDPAEYENMHPEHESEIKADAEVSTAISRADDIRKKFPNLNNPSIPDDVILKWAESRGL